MTNILKTVISIMPLLLIACVSQPPKAQQDQVKDNQQRTQKITTNTMSNSEEKTTSSKSESLVDAGKINETATAPQAVLSLIERSLQQLNNDDLKGAGRSLERAIRITPRYPESYYYLAKVRYLEGRYKQARSLAKKALSLGAQDSLLESVLVLLDNIHESEGQ
jgi:Tfp pilus assembly protein PilF